MVRLILIPSLVIAFTFTSIAFGEKGEWQSLFNGKDLTGWKANLLPESFTVEAGAIKAHCKDPELRKSHLFYVGDNEDEFVLFKDFEFETMVRCEPGSNSGVFFHTDEVIRDDKHHLGSGYEVQINNGEKPKSKTGSLYAIADFEEPIIDETQWFKLTIKVIGKRIQVSLNDQQVIDYTEPKNPERAANRIGRILRPQGGAIALQGHDPASIVYFKDIRIRVLN